MSQENIRGYVRKPWWIYAIAIGYALVPAVTLVQFGHQFGFNSNVLIGVASSSYFITETLAALSGACAVLIVSRWTFAYFVALSFSTVSLRIFQYSQDQLLGTPVDGILAAFWLVAGVIALSKELRTPYLNPRVRWWSQPERVDFISHSALEFAGVHYPIVTLNMSTGGAFIKLDQRRFSEYSDGASGMERRKREPTGGVILSADQIEEAHAHLDSFPNQLGDPVTLHIQLLPEAAEMFDSPTCDVRAEVAWAAAQNSDYRYGLGLRFVDQSREARDQLAAYLENLQSKGFETRTSKLTKR